MAVPLSADEWEGKPRSALHLVGRPPIRTPERWEFELLRLLAEQSAIPFDQLARFLGCEGEQAARVAKHLSKAGYTDYGRTLAYEPHWLWLTGRGVRFSGMQLQPGCPRVGAMARMRAVNEIRLHIAQRAPEARWLCGRSIVRQQGVRGYRPNAVVEVGGERHAVLFIASPQRPERTIQVCETHMRRYDALITFCTRRSYAAMKRLAASRHWPKLVIRRIPEPGLGGRTPPDGGRIAAPQRLPGVQPNGDQREGHSAAPTESPYQPTPAGR